MHRLSAFFPTVTLPRFFPTFCLSDLAPAILNGTDANKEILGVIVKISIDLLIAVCPTISGCKKACHLA